MLTGKELWFRYASQMPWVVQDQTISVAPGEVVGLMAPSGFGKTTLVKLLAGYLIPTKGQVSVDGQSLPRRCYCPVQLVFQNPELSVNPRWRIDQILREGHPPQMHQLDALGIHAGWLTRYPHELSGGELQRIAIARTLNSQTRYLIADEMTAMLDANTQALIWQAVLDYTRAHQIGVLVVSHDWPLVRRLCDRILDLAATQDHRTLISQ
ncbi:ABC transporter ATP-binding protein [Phormidium tenue]|uniref:ABC transporter ATP-binding protein n=1 Tax=Phormidium tenue NIES-30 TaxID=549789 RepID=A0A1U7J2A4_9CYAN|nr:ATP-binding cassette domain-containing protein [Phormidium tenue]MBD2233765.1 ATP-binding cassette domain-containing protein [Phormidium tenue FACHB-1052]OKH46178.1 ABC transporter ATP-binding protein [Phormidium tenue NIES-30]